MLFDTHAHVLSADLERYPYSTLRGGAKLPVSPMVFPIEDLVRQMDGCGVDHFRIEPRTRGELAQEVAAVTVGPFHHGGD